jgi:putative transposase
MNERKPRGPKPKKLKLSQKEDQILRKLIKRPSTTQQTAQRARIVRQSAKDVRIQHVANDEKVTVNTVKKWRGRWLEAEAYLSEIETAGTKKEQEAAIKSILSDQPRSGTPAKFTAEQVCQIIAIACESPEESERPVTEWTPREIADEAIKRGIVSSISTRQTGRFLKRSRSEAPSQSLLVEQ